MTDTPSASTGLPAEEETQHALEAIQKALRGLRFGQVTVTVQDGVVIQVERVERTRLRRPGSKR